MRTSAVGSASYEAHLPPKKLAKQWVPIAGLVALITAFGAGTLWLPANSSGRDVAVFLWGAVPAAVAIWEYSYHRIERHRLLVDRALFWLMNRESSWSMTAEFDVSDLATAFSSASSVVDTLPQARRLSDAPGIAVWQVSGSTVQLVADVATGLHDETGVLTLEFPPAPRQFRAWPGVIGGTVDATVSAVQDNVPPGDRKFTAKIGFPSTNPYFGLFANSPSTLVRRFDIELAEQAHNGVDWVRVRNNRIELVTSSLTALRQLSLRYLALRPVDVT